MQVLDVIQDALSNLQLSNENFRVQVQTDVWKPGTVFTLNRTVARVTKQVSYSSLNAKDRFLWDGHEHMKCLVQSDSISSVWNFMVLALEGPNGGKVLNYAPDMVNKIVE